MLVIPRFLPRFFFHSSNSRPKPSKTLISQLRTLLQNPSPARDDAQIKSAEFVKSSTKNEEFPSDGLPEFALVGRSNVGKSSLLNSFVRRKKLALTSKKPVSFGFKSADDYYFNSSSSLSIENVQTPMLCIQAANDPIAPSRGIPRAEIMEAAFVMPVLLNNFHLLYSYIHSDTYWDQNCFSVILKWKLCPTTESDLICKSDFRICSIIIWFLDGKMEGMELRVYAMVVVVLLLLC